MNAVSSNLMAASNQWASRPAEQRFLSISDMLSKAERDKRNSKAKTVSTRAFQLIPEADHRGLTIQGQNGSPAVLTHYSFGQLAGLAGAPAGYLRDLPAEITADALNYGLRFKREAEDVGVLLTRIFDGDDESSNQPTQIELRAATGPNYGRIWNADLIRAAHNVFGDGTREGGGTWQVPGIFRKQVPITIDNTTLYYGDRTMFIFLCDESEHGTFEIAQRRNGQSGEAARGFFLWNSEVGASTMGIAMFFYDEVCGNRIVWGAREYTELRIRHTASAPDKFIEEVRPVIDAYAKADIGPIAETVKAAQQAKIDGDLDDFLKNKRFTKPEATAIKAAHEREEGRPIETLWDLTTGITAAAKDIKWTDDRVAFERRGGEILDLVAA